MLAQSHLDDSFQNRIKTEGQHQTNDNRQDGRPGLAINVGTIGIADKMMIGIKVIIPPTVILWRGVPPISMMACLSKR